MDESAVPETLMVKVLLLASWKLSLRVKLTGLSEMKDT